MERIRIYETQNYEILADKIINGSVSPENTNKAIENACKAKRLAVQLNAYIDSKDVKTAIRSAENALVYAELVIKQ
jgi:hypothetical protein